MVGPAILLAADFMFISAFCKNSVVDTVHYATIFLWVLGNSTWALGEFFDNKDDAPIPLWQLSTKSLRTARWYSSWILLLSLLPSFILYAVWIPLTLSGQLDNLSVDRNMKVEIGTDRWGLTTYQEGEEHDKSGSEVDGVSTRARGVSDSSPNRVRNSNALTYRGKVQGSYHYPPSYAADNDTKREKGERNQSKGTRDRLKNSGDILEPIYENVEDILKDNENELYINEDGNHDNTLEIVNGSHPPLTEESHHIIVSGTFV
eukprot:CAMPEP_0119044572 /NCGR_PEP_ID=MMETSP1177-20130426/32579_1 /TAXON_ID=2985 /ORGANISM="Ochromonas sp, Strain CCMP1899" /LENGTH=260 /DNA_ID=CAMNT_0007014867 /DNA_START=717 /DNA_END=1499 /DNA_ORIENTATION=+